MHRTLCAHQEKAAINEVLVKSNSRAQLNYTLAMKLAEKIGGGVGWHGERRRVSSSCCISGVVSISTCPPLLLQHKTVRTLHAVACSTAMRGRSCMQAGLR